MDFGKCSKSAKEDCSCCPLFSSLLPFASLLLLACFGVAKSLLSLVQEAPPSFGMLELIHMLIKTCKLATKWLKPITKDLNELIRLNEYDYYTKVLKTIIIRSTK